MHIEQKLIRFPLYCLFFIVVISFFYGCISSYQPTYQMVSQIEAKAVQSFDGTWVTSKKDVVTIDKGRIWAAKDNGINSGGIWGKNIEKMAPGKYKLKWLTWDKKKEVSGYGPATLTMKTPTQMQLTILPNPVTNIGRQTDYILNISRFNKTFAYLSEWEQQEEIKPQIDLILKAYRSFIYKNRKNPDVYKARSRIETLEWSKAASVNTIYAYNKYLRSYPKSPHKAKVKEQIAKVKWETARKKDTIAGYRQYLRYNRRSGYEKEAKARMTALEWENIEAKNNKAAYQKFLKAHPKTV